MANNFECNFKPNSFVIPAANGPDRGIVQNRPYLAFDDTTTETAYTVAARMPTTYTGSGTLKADIYYVMASATADLVEFEVAVEAVTDADATDLDAGTSFDTANSGSATVPATAGYLDVITVTLTNKDSVAAGDMVRLSVARDADDGSNDTATGDARVLLVVLREEV